MSIRDRMGFDAGDMRLEKALEWAAPHGFHRGQGNMDFAALVQRLELSGYRHHDIMAIGSPDDKLAGRDYFTACRPEG